MKKHLLIKLLLCLFITLMLVSCNSKEEETPTNNNNNSQGCDIVDDDCGDDDNNTTGMNFKQAYESLNGKQNSSGKDHRVINIDEDNPFVKVEAKDIIKKIENKETFYVYIGDEMCPWCRSVIEKAIEVSKIANINTIYYLEIWDDEGNEVLRDKYIIEEGKLVQEVETSEEYKKLLEYWDSVLDDYILSDDQDNEIAVNEKRIYAPNFIYVENGEAIRFTTGTSEKQTESRQELSDDILQDEINMFEEFFGVKQ